MKFEKVAKFHKMLQKRLGDDLTYSLVLDNDETLSLYISAHASKTRENKDKMVRCLLQPKDLNKEVLLLVNEIAIMYQGQFIDRVKDDAIERSSQSEKN